MCWDGSLSALQGFLLYGTERVRSYEGGMKHLDNEDSDSGLFSHTIVFV